MKTNLEATIDFVKKFLPLLHPQGRLVIVSTIYASFGNQTTHMKKILRNPQITEEEILNISK
jgi:NAD(P)-dependent dehydrogenase (short-subunit alcohol dehydrogenase family)